MINNRMIAALDWAIREGMDNSQMSVAKEEVNAGLYYGAINFTWNIAPHLAIWVDDDSARMIAREARPDAVLETEEDDTIFIYYFEA